MSEVNNYKLDGVDESVGNDDTEDLEDELEGTEDDEDDEEDEDKSSGDDSEAV